MQLKFGEIVLDLGTREIHRGDETVAVSPKAFQLLELLVRERPNAVSKDEIHRSLWPDTFVADGNLANLVSELREALGDNARESRLIRTVPRFGYAFPVQTQTLPMARALEHPAGTSRLLWGEQEIALGEGENMIGRDPAATVHIDDVSVSRYHARIVIDGSAARIEDLGSKNGTFVRESRVATAVPLRDGDAIRLGSVAVVFHRSEAGAPTQTATRQ